MLKRIFTFITAAVIAAISSAAVSAESSTVKEIALREVSIPVPHSMVVMGDSIASGYGLEGYAAGSGSPLSYSNLLKAEYSPQLPSDCTFELTNLAVDGYTSDDLLKLLDSGKADDALSKADCIVISIGGNDLLHALWDTLKDAGISFESGGKLGASELLKLISSFSKLREKLDANLTVFDENLPKIAAYIRKKTASEFFIQTLYDPLESFSLVPGISKIAAEKIGRLNEIIKAHAGSYTVCDVAPAFAGKAKELTNIARVDIHPNAEGHKLISETLDKSIKAGSYSYQQEYVIERTIADDAADTDSAGSLQGNSTVMIIVICSVCALAAGAGIVYLIIKKRP
ncbi:MAG: SGNH/GDSL hydrolase family protein [Ruminococcus sp.]|nr:SGNH/GDSL hydrolase family protein [Ruminococcus sp.]